MEKKLLLDSPLKGVKRPPKRKRKRIMEPAERQLMLSSIRDQFFKDYCFALLDTGARPMEVAAVTAAQVSRDCSMWILDEHKTDREVEATVIPAATDARVTNMKPPTVGVVPAPESQRRTVAEK